jgi:RNA polymerase sigma-70 factor (ECF subfamily)
MFNTCLRITNNREDAEDLLQEAFLNAFQKIGSFKEESTIGAWLKRIVVNHAINHIRKRKVETESLEENDQHVGEENPGMLDEFLLHSQVEKVKKGVERLPSGYRIIFSLYMLEGFDHGEIAEMLSISVSTSKSQLNRAKKKLRDILNVEVNYG